MRRMRMGAGLMIGAWLAAAALAQDAPASKAKPTHEAKKPDESKAAQAKPDPAKGAAPKSEPEMEAAMAAMMPGPMHGRLTALAGDWETRSRLEMAGQEPAESSGTATLKAELGGRFIHETGRGEMMGMPTEHFKLWGYNAGSKKFEAVWTWTMSTGLLSMVGETKDDGKSIEWKAWFDNEVGVREDFKALTTFVDDDHFTVKLYGGKMPDGTPGPTMLVEYSRKKPAGK